MAFETSFMVEWGDCDDAGIVFYPNYFYWLDSTFQRWLRAKGVSLRDVRKRYDVSVPNGLLLKGLIWTCRAAPDRRYVPLLESLVKDCLSITPFGKRFAEGATACKRVLDELD